MKKNNIHTFLLFVVSTLLTQCVGLQPITFEENTNATKFSPENEQEYSSESVKIDNPLLSDGVFENFQNELVGWWGSGDVIKFSKGKDYLEVEANKTVAGYPQFGFVFEPKNFTSTPVVRVRMRIEGTEPARIRLDLKDINETSTNAIIVSNEIEVSNEYKDYYFDFNNKFKQSWPSMAEVDPRQISGMAFFVCPGDKLYKGKIFIKEIYVMANKDGSGIVSKEVLLDDFSGDINYWWGCDKERVLLSKQGKSLSVGFKSGQWSCFGMTFDPTDISSTPVIKLRIKAKSTGKAPNVDVVAYFTDTHNKTSNALGKPQKVTIGSDYIDYFYDYKENMASTDGPFDSKSVQGIIIFVNTIGTEVFNGNLFLDEVVFLPSVPKYVSKRIQLSKPFIIDSSWTKGTAVSMLDNFEKDDKSWNVSNSRMKISIGERSLKIISDSVGPEWESLNKNLTNINFLDKPVLKIRVKAEGNLSPFLRIVLTDNFGNISNARPAEEKIEIQKGYMDYYFDFTGRFQQRFPELKNINPMAIDKLSLYVNGGGEAYSGTLSIESIQTITVNEYLKAVK
jgi:hypothetical protein